MNYKRVDLVDFVFKNLILSDTIWHSKNHFFPISRTRLDTLKLEIARGDNHTRCWCNGYARISLAKFKVAQSRIFVPLASSKNILRASGTLSKETLLSFLEVTIGTNTWRDRWDIHTLRWSGLQTDRELNIPVRSHVMLTCISSSSSIPEVTYHLNIYDNVSF